MCAPTRTSSAAVSALYDKISTPVLTDVALDFGDVTVEDAYPYPLPDLFAGGQLVLVGRYRRGRRYATITLRGTVNGRAVRLYLRGRALRARRAAPTLSRACGPRARSATC